MSIHQTVTPDSNSTQKISDYIPILPNPDGTITRIFQIPSTPATPDPNSPYPVLSKDVPLNPNHNTWARIYLPREALHNSPTTTTKLPIIVYYHGGGFVILSAASTKQQDFCIEIAARLRVVIISVEYRLAPEHRLPAAYEDAMDALQRIRTSLDEWLDQFGDLSNCFIMGSSAGANIAYHVGLRAAAAVDDLLPLKIKGLILHQPYFGGSQRTKSELRLINDRVLPLFVNDFLWKLALPVGVDRDHEYCNPTVGGGSNESDACERFRDLGWRVMVTGCDGDPLMDRQIELVKMLEEKGVQVVCEFGEGGCHGIEFVDSSKAVALCVALKHFLLK